jgi:DNA-binding MarR family transcriptional regulator
VDARLAPSIPGGEALARSARVFAWIAKSLEGACARSGLSLPKYRVLFLVQVSPFRAAEVANLARVGPSTLTVLAESLERDGYLERVPSRSDRRGVRLRITDAGVEAVQRTERSLVQELQGLCELFGNFGEVESFAAVYDRIVERAQRDGLFVALGLEHCSTPVPEDTVE